MYKFLHADDNDNPEAITLPPVFSENSRANGANCEDRLN